MYIELNKLIKTYKMGDVTITAVDKVSFGIEKGELAVVLGPSGAGKTTVLNILGGMDRSDSGTITIDDKDISKYSNQELTKYRRNDIGFIFQFYNLVQNLTSLENIELTNQICKDTLPAKEVLISVGLKDRMNNFPSQLSGGEQQRVAIARALAKKPKLLLCDEPTGALDSKTGQKVLEVLQKTCKEYGMTVVIITHNSVIAQIANRVIKMKNGTVEEITINEHPLDIKEINW
ncbi:ABC transporter ATP-binding protein [Candidatus Saccharibacteria bacterium]|jgi:putative ABC transport system ATP-binding protein|nr:ABC transporter ATP-binding protein [Bacilli bacterium]NLA43666.1 ABC transporter ATP-binding protein [Candidatus Saccharibacteria bacterium]